MAKEKGQITIYGSSDDLIEIDGDIQEEMNGYSADKDDEPCYLAVSDGTLLKVKYDGCWRFTCVKKGSAVMVNSNDADDDKDGSRPDGKPWYSEIVTLTGDNLRWVVRGVELAK
jgi:hypothetical protein